MSVEFLCFLADEVYRKANPLRFKVGDQAKITDAPEGYENFLGETVIIEEAGPWWIPEVQKYVHYKVRRIDGKSVGLQDCHLSPLQAFEAPYERAVQPDDSYQAMAFAIFGRAEDQS